MKEINAKLFFVTRLLFRCLDIVCKELLSNYKLSEYFINNYALFLIFNKRKKYKLLRVFHNLRLTKDKNHYNSHFAASLKLQSVKRRYLRETSQTLGFNISLLLSQVFTLLFYFYIKLLKMYRKLYI